MYRLCTVVTIAHLMEVRCQSGSYHESWAFFLDHGDDYCPSLSDILSAYENTLYLAGSTMTKTSDSR